MRGFFSRRQPAFTTILLIESGSRSLFDRLIPILYQANGDEMKIDLITCYAGVPAGFRDGRVYRVTDYRGGDARQRLYSELASNGYAAAGMICSGEPIMFKWKWMFAGHVPAKFFVLNENGDYFWMQYDRWRIMLHFILFRAGLTGGAAIPTIARLLFFPLILLYLIAYAGFVHLRRKLRTS